MNSIAKGGSVTIADNIDYRRRDAKDDLVDARADLKRYQDSEKLLGAGARADDIVRANRSIARATAEQTALDSLSKMFAADGTLNDTVSVTWIWKYRAKNALGALVIGEKMDLTLYGGEAVVRENRVVSRLRSAGYGHHVKKNIGLAYLPVNLAVEGTEVAVELFGDLIPAIVAPATLYDPEGSVIRRDRDV